MWTKEDFDAIFKHLSGDTNVELYEPLYAIAQSDKGTLEVFFEKTLDQVAFASEDYKRLRAFLIDWFASHRTLTTVQKDISDLYVLPNSHLDELFRSYGYPYSNKLTYVNNRINYNKVSFFLDLVNLYKIKGSPGSVAHALRYHGIPSIQIFEYMVKMNYGDNVSPEARIYFESILAKSVGYNVDTLPTVLTFEEGTDWDPHWMTSESKMVNQQLALNNHLPAKSPYYSLRIYLDMSELSLLFAHINRHMADQYDYILTNHTYPATDLFSVVLNKYVSLLELYASMVYVFDKTFPDEEYGTPDQTLIYKYNKNPNSYTAITTDYESLHGEQHSRDEREENIRQYYNDFTVDFSEHIFPGSGSAEDILSSIFPESKDRLDGLLSITPGATILGQLSEEFSSWVKTYFSIYVPNLGYMILGQEELLRDLGGIINFFKPYHARLLLTDFGLIFNDRLEESIRLKDYCTDIIVEQIVDWDTCNSRPCCNDQSLNCPTGNALSYSRDTYDCGSYYDIGAACDPPDSFQTTITDHFVDKLAMRKHGEIIPSALIESDTVGTTSYAVQSGGFVVFDEGGYFDDQYASDVCFIIIDDNITPDVVFDFYSDETYSAPYRSNVELQVA